MEFKNYFNGKEVEMVCDSDVLNGGLIMDTVKFFGKHPVVGTMIAIPTAMFYSILISIIFSNNK